MALKPFPRLVFLAVIFTTLLFPLVSGNVCSGDGSTTDTCPEGEYCDGGSCYNCSLCSINGLLEGMALTKCLCVPSSHKICKIRASGEELIEHPSQLSFTNWTGYENVDFTYLRESYNRTNIDCTVPTTTKEPTSLAVMTTILTTTSMPKTPEQTSSPIQCSTKEATPGQDSLMSECQVFIMVIVVLVVILVALVVWIILIHRGIWMIQCLKKEEVRNSRGNTDAETDAETGVGEGGGPTESYPLRSAGSNQDNPNAD